MTSTPPEIAVGKTTPVFFLIGQVWESQKRININSNDRYHQCSSDYASLNWSSNKVRFIFNQPSFKRWSARLVDVGEHLPHKVFLFWHHFIATVLKWFASDTARTFFCLYIYIYIYVYMYIFVIYIYIYMLHII